MIIGFEGCRLWADVVVEALWRQLPPTDKPTRGPTAGVVARALIAMTLVGACCGWTLETTLQPAAARPGRGSTQESQE